MNTGKHIEENQSPTPHTINPPHHTTPEPFSIFDQRQKALIIFLVSTAATCSGFASNPYFPALPTIAEDLSVSIELVNLTVTSYLIFQGTTPSLWGPISDVKGRRVAYIGTFIVFLAACIGLANTKNYATLITLRCLQSTGSASTIALGSGVIGDITTREDRGSYMGIFQAGILVPVAVGPVIGGALAGSLGWRSIFWFLAIYSGVILIFLVLLLPETLRSLVGNGSRKPTNPINAYPLTVYQRLTQQPWKPQAITSQPPTKHVDLIGPFRMLVSKQAAPLVFFLATYYAIWQASITAMSTLFSDSYHLGTTQIGLTFIANGVGSIVGTLLSGKILDVDYRRVKASYEGATRSGPEAGSSRDCDLDDDNDFPLEKARLRLVPILAFLQCISIIVFGWTIQYTVHIAVPIITTFITGWTAVSTQCIVSTYLVDVFPKNSAAATASLNLARCLFAAGATSVVMPMVNGIGAGWTFTVCVGVQIIAFMGVIVQWKFGAQWRRDADRRDKTEVSDDGN